MVTYDISRSFSARWISWAVQLGKARLLDAVRKRPPCNRWIVKPGRRPAGRLGEDCSGTSTHTSGKPHDSYSANLPRRTSVVLSTSSTTSGRVSLPTSILAPSGRVARGCRYTVWSASRMRR